MRVRFVERYDESNFKIRIFTEFFSSLSELCGGKNQFIIRTYLCVFYWKLMWIISIFGKVFINSLNMSVNV